MRIDQLRLKNFRGFEDFSIDLDPQFTLLIGANGSGKSAVLDGLTIAAGSWLLGIPGYDSRHIEPHDVRLVRMEFEDQVAHEPQYPVVVEAAGIFGGWNREQTWLRELRRQGGRTTYARALNIKGEAEKFHRIVQAGGSCTLPLISSYGTGRLHQETRRQQEANKPSKDAVGISRLDGYLYSVDQRISKHQIFSWLLSQYGVRRRRTGFLLFEQTLTQCFDQIESVRMTIEFSTHSPQFDLLVKFSDQDELPFDALSDGQRMIILLVADIVRKAVILNPHLAQDAVRETPGVVLIDEIDLHLHPRWQRSIVSNLKKAFPALQFVASTHSPQIIGEVPPEQIRVLRADGRVEGVPGSLGRTSNWVLTHLMESEERNVEFQKKLKEAETLIHDCEYEKAQEILKSMRQAYGDDVDIVGLDAAIERELLED